MASNPYESPKADLSAPDQQVRPATRWKAARAGMWRGARIGFLTFVIAVIFAATLAVVIRLFLDGWRLPSDVELATWLDVAKWLGMFVLGLCVMGALYGAVPGAIILGIVAAVRWRRPETVPKPQNF
jgi:hypothetical protein